MHLVCCGTNIGKIVVVVCFSFAKTQLTWWSGDNTDHMGVELIRSLVSSPSCNLAKTGWFTPGDDKH